MNAVKMIFHGDLTSLLNQLGCKSEILCERISQLKWLTDFYYENKQGEFFGRQFNVAWWNNVKARGEIEYYIYSTHILIQ